MSWDIRTHLSDSRPKYFFRNEKGAIDLSSIMVGIIVIGLIGGIIAATVFAIIPWTQDKAAKQQLDAIAVAQSSYMGLSSGVPPAVPSGHQPNSYANSKLLVTAGLLAENENYCTMKTKDGKGYLAVVLSGSGKYWTLDDSNTQAKEIAPIEVPENCGFPYVDKTPTLTKLTYNCPTTKSVSVPITGFSGKGTATWSDGVISPSGSPIKRVLEAGVEYKVTFDGTYKTFGGLYASRPGMDCLISVDHWGLETGVTDANRAFADAVNLVNVPSHIPSTITTTNSMFSGASVINDPDIGNWDVSNVTDMSYMFSRAYAFNQSLNSWDVSKVTNMKNMFWNMLQFNQSLADWDVSKVTDMTEMFSYSYNYNQPMNDWDVSNVTNMSGMMAGLYEFNQPLDKWNTSNVTNMKSMFSSARKFDQPINQWNTSKVTDMSYMFGAGVVFNQPLDRWDVSKVTNMSQMFANASKFDQPLNSWNVSKVTDMSWLFFETEAFNQPLDKWDVSNVTNMYRMFGSSKSFNQSLNDWDMSSTETIESMFEGTLAFNQPLDKWDVSNVTNMNGVFWGAKAFNKPLNEWDVSNVTDMSYLFYNSPYNQPLNDWDVSNVTDMNHMFRHNAVFNHPLNKWDVSSVTNMDYMFGSSNFQQDLSGWKTTSLQTGKSFSWILLEEYFPVGVSKGW